MKSSRLLFVALALFSLVSVAHLAGTVSWTGVNLAGAEFDGTAVWPTTADMDYFASKGMNIFRIPFKWERLQPSLGGAFDSTYASQLESVVTYATNKGVYIVLDVHNYARFNGQVIGNGVSNENLADLWTRLANKYKDNDKVLFGLMNEPYDMPNINWKNGAQAAVNAIRATGATNYILLPGNGWTGAHSWLQNWYDKDADPKKSNAETMIQVADSANKMIFEVHQYFDNGFSGTTPDCLAPTIGKDKLVEFTNWLRQNNRKGFLGEFGGAENTNCFSALTDALQYMQDNNDVWVGWTYWAAGTAWPVEYIYSIQPKNNFQTDRPQLAYILPFISKDTDVSIPMAPFSIPPQSPTSPQNPPPSNSNSCSGGSSLTVFDDALQNGFENWSWATDMNLADTSLVHSGSKSVSFVPQSFQALFFALSSSTFSTSSYSGIEFYINGAPNGGQQIRVGFRKVKDTEYGSPTYVNINNYIDGSSIGNTWKRVYVPFSAMNIGAGDSLMSITIQADIQNAQSRVYVDDIKLICDASNNQTPSSSQSQTPSTSSSRSPSANISSTATSLVSASIYSVIALILLFVH